MLYKSKMSSFYVFFYLTAREREKFKAQKKTGNTETKTNNKNFNDQLTKKEEKKKKKREEKRKDKKDLENQGKQNSSEIQNTHEAQKLHTPTKASSTGNND